MLRRIEARAATGSIQGVRISLHPELADALQNHYRQELSALEEEFDIEIEIIAAPGLHRPDEQIEWQKREKPAAVQAEARPHHPPGLGPGPARGEEEEEDEELLEGEEHDDEDHDEEPRGAAETDEAAQRRKRRRRGGRKRKKKAGPGRRATATEPTTKPGPSSPRPNGSPLLPCARVSRPRRQRDEADPFDDEDDEATKARTTTSRRGRKATAAPVRRAKPGPQAVPSGDGGGGGGGSKELSQ